MKITDKEQTGANSGKWRHFSGGQWFGSAALRPDAKAGKTNAKMQNVSVNDPNEELNNDITFIFTDKLQ